jgi:hypothetical protein
MIKRPEKYGLRRVPCNHIQEVNWDREQHRQRNRMPLNFVGGASTGLPEDSHFSIHAMPDAQKKGEITLTSPFDQI